MTSPSENLLGTVVCATAESAETDKTINTMRCNRTLLVIPGTPCCVRTDGSVTVVLGAAPCPGHEVTGAVRNQRLPRDLYAHDGKLARQGHEHRRPNTPIEGPVVAVSLA
jgi:hypothetical protein